MTDIIVILVIAVFVLLGVKSTIKHFKGEGACCGGHRFNGYLKNVSSIYGLWSIYTNMKW